MSELEIQQTNKFKKYLLYIIVGLVIFGVGFFMGNARNLAEELYDESGDVQISKVLNLYSKTRSENIDFNQYWDIWDTIKQNYVSQPVDDVSLFYSSLEGLVDGLGDTYSIYFPPEKAKEFMRDLSGEFEGIGAEIGLRDKYVTIIAPLPGSPAEQAGLKAGDKIFAVDGEDISGLSLQDVVLKIKGERGTQVVLSITSNGFDTLRDVTITRDTISVPTVDWRKEQDGIVYLRVSYINDTTWTEFDKAVKDILVTAPQGIVLDVRSNPGGYLDASVRIAAEWIDKGTVVSERFNDDSRNEHTADEGKHRFVGLPTVVLIDEGTASGAEIIAGALQDYNVATVIGKTTFGKGSVQEFEPFPDGSALKLTVAKWFTPRGRQIDEKGIEPDEDVGEMFVQKDNTDGTHEEDYVDHGLNRALELLQHN